MRCNSPKLQNLAVQILSSLIDIDKEDIDGQYQAIVLISHLISWKNIKTKKIFLNKKIFAKSLKLKPKIFCCFSIFPWN